jgi:thiamine biosynthesis lipoprotein
MNRAYPLWIALAIGACHDRTSAIRPAPPPPASSTSASGSAASIDATAAAASASATASVMGASAFVPVKVTAQGKAMGTHLAFAAYTTPKADEDKLRRTFDAAIAEIERIEKLMTTWTPDSELSRVNAAAGKSPVEVSAETFGVVKEAVHASEISEGAFDITFESLHGLWKFDEDLDPHPPTDAQIKSKLANVGYAHIHLDEPKHTIFLDRPGTKISLGGIAKGYAVDKAAQVLRESGITAFFVQAGGDLYTAGRKPDGSEWAAGIRDPRGAESAYFAMVPVSDHAFSTAGDYERSYVVGGKRYHHIIDPKTGHPATASRSVTIWAPTALLADEIDDAVFILGPEKGMKLVESIDGVGAVIVDAKNNVHVSKRLRGLIRFVAAPTDGP